MCPNFLLCTCCLDSVHVVPVVMFRSGWQPPQDYGLWKPSGVLRQKLLSSLHDDALGYWNAEDGYFNMVTSISGQCCTGTMVEYDGALQAV